MSLTREGGDGGGTASHSRCITGTCLPSLSTLTSSSQPSFTATLTLPIPPHGSITLTSLITMSPTSTTTSTIITTSSNIISTTTATSLSITALPNPAATAAISAQSSLLRQNAGLARANFTSTLVLGLVAFVLLLALLILFIIYLLQRRRSSPTKDSEYPPFTSLAPAPIAETAPQIPLPALITQQEETSLSMGPQLSRRPSTSGPSRSFHFGFPSPLNASDGSLSGRGRQDPLASHPLAPPTHQSDRLMRVSSVPEQAPTSLPRVSLFPGSSRSRESIRTGSTFGASSPGLRRQRSVPMYHAALTEQVEREREEVRSAEAVRLGIPVIERHEERIRRNSAESEISSEVGFEDDQEEVGEGSGIQHADGNGGMGGDNSGQGSGERGGRLLHSTRASSGVFPEWRDSRDEDGAEEVDEERIYS